MEENGRKQDIEALLQDNTVEIIQGQPTYQSLTKKYCSCPNCDR